jgi:hypothetical protein
VKGLVRAALAAAIVASAAAAAHGQPTPGPDLAARIQAIETPAALDRGEVTSAVLEVRNAGTEAWPADGAVRLAYHWIRADGSVAVGGGRRTHMPVLVPPGATVRLCAVLEAPDEPGDLRLEWDLVKEGVAWFSHRDPENLLRQQVHVRGAAAPVSRGAPLAIAAWLIVSLAHVLVSAAWARRGGAATLDARLFDTVLFAAGTLHGVLFAASTITGLGHLRGVWWLAAFDALAVLGLLRARRAPAGTGAGPEAVADGPTPASRGLALVSTALQAAGAMALVTLAVSWTRLAARSFHVSGSDAAHYHVPNVVNLALGASPFDLMPTPHAYPMGASLVGAWFVLPVGDPWIIDLAMLAFFTLLAASLVRAFTIVTGQPGLAWVPWLLLAGMATPLFQHASLFSADLPFAAAFTASVTQLLAWRARGRIAVRDAILGGLAFGLMCGVKTTGTPMLVLLLGVATVVWIARRSRATPVPLTRHVRAGLVGAFVLAWLAGGGLWLVRNAITQGSPVAPSGLKVRGVTIFKGETLEESASYYSVAGDVAATPGYPLRRRVSFYVRQQLGPILPPIAILLGLLALDVALGFRPGRRPGRNPGRIAGTATRDDPRLALILGFAGIAAVFLWLLAHAPWSSLDWTRGLSLRYALPIIVGAGFLAFLALFPRSLPWYEDPVPAALGGVFLAGVSLYWFVHGRAAIPATSPDPVPALDLVSCGVAAGLLAAIWLTSRNRTGRLAGLAAIVLGVWPTATRLAAQDAGLAAGGRQEETRLVRCLAAGTTGELERHRAIHLGLLAAEGRRHQSCPTRRIFLGAAFDLPLELQSLPFSTLVFEARQASLDPTSSLDAGRRPCDYVIVTRAELDTLRGSRLLQRVTARQPWTEVAAGGGFVAFAATPAPPCASK